MKPILEIKNISKKYNLRGQESPYLTLREALMGKRTRQSNEFWALDDVNFDVNPGDSVGIIGKNGAGKSTLLKILSKITPPTKGEIILRGRIASLLEVGTGFHPELTGTENIYLNGSILGLKKQEIKAKFDEIVDFSGVEKFLQTPLKHYSSGMTLRLAFAVAAHLEPEILIIDEVLAVGDAEFQKKSLGKMEDITKQGRTVLFVSHNMPAVQNLCNKGVLLENGKVSLTGDMDQVIGKYLNNENIRTSYQVKDSSKEVYIKEIKIEDKNVHGHHYSHNELTINTIIVNNASIKGLFFAIAFVDKYGERIFTEYIELTENQKTTELSCSIPKDTFLQGEYKIDAAIFIPMLKSYDELLSILNFEIINTSLNSMKFLGANIGKIQVKSKWEIK